MDYVYDILLNFNENLIEYFEWDDKDNIKYIKKIMLFKTDEKTLKDIVNCEVLLDNSFTSCISKYEINNLKDECKLCLLTDGKIAIGIMIEDGIVRYISRLLLDEESEVLSLSDNLVTTRINYKIIKNKTKINNSLTRTQSRIKKQLLVTIDSLYKNNNYDKLIYLYYEFTNNECKDIDHIYMYLKKSLNEFNDKHIHLFDILSMCNIKVD